MEHTELKHLILIGVSTGGPESLNEIIPFLYPNKEVSIIIVQHMPKGFTYHLANRLNVLSKVEVKEALDQEYLKGGTVYIAPSGHNLLVKEDRQLKLTFNKYGHYHQPSVDVLFSSVAESFQNQDIFITACILTGMGQDGLKGVQTLKKLRKNNLYVISQQLKTCYIDSMPKAIETHHLNDKSMSLKEITNYINKLK